LIGRSYGGSRRGNSPRASTGGLPEDSPALNACLGITGYQRSIPHCDSSDFTAIFRVVAKFSNDTKRIRIPAFFTQAITSSSVLPEQSVIAHVLLLDLNGRPTTRAHVNDDQDRANASHHNSHGSVKKSNKAREESHEKLNAPESEQCV
jgi:hypothetical protein